VRLAIPPDATRSGTSAENPATETRHLVNAARPWRRASMPRPPRRWWGGPAST